MSRGGADARRRYRHLAGGPGRDPGGGLRRRGDVGLPLDVGAVPRSRAGLRASPRRRSSRPRCSPSARTPRARRRTRAPPATSRSPTPATTRTASRPSKGARSVPPPMSIPTATPATPRPGAGFTVAPDGTPVVDAGSATSRIPAAGVRLTESLSDQPRDPGRPRPGPCRGTGRRRRARRATPPSPTRPGLVERYSHDVSTWATAHSPGAFRRARARRRKHLQSHVDKLAEIGRHHEEPGDGADRRGEGGRKLELHRQARRRRLRHVAGTDHRVRRLEPDAANTTASTG